MGLRQAAASCALLLYIGIGCTVVQPRLEEGDILFMVNRSSRFTEAVRAATLRDGAEGYTHTGLLTRENGTWMVIEADFEGVQPTPLEAFLARAAHSAEDRPLVAVGRIAASRRGLIPMAVARARSYLGRPYDPLFAPGDDAIYCSELIALCFRDSVGQPLFREMPMTFRDSTGHPAAGWVEHFARLGASVPEGVPGTNPQALSGDASIRIVFRYFKPDNR